MKVLIATPLYPPQIGGPAKYAQALSEWLPNVGHEAPVLSYGWVERHLPSGVRHLWYFLRLLPQVFGVDAVFALDTWSVGLPALIAAKLARKKLLVADRPVAGTIRTYPCALPRARKLLPARACNLQGLGARIRLRRAGDPA